MSAALHEEHLMPSQLRAKLAVFMQDIHCFSEILGIDLTPFQADHIALRINEHHLAELAHQAWKEEGQVVSQAMINGRPIIIILLDKPLEFQSWCIDCVELPYPAQGKHYPLQSWEHVEFVIPSEAATVEQYWAELQQRFPSLQETSRFAKNGIQIKLSSPKGDSERLSNPTVAFKWQNITIKLHPYSLQTIIASEY